MTPRFINVFIVGFTTARIYFRKSSISISTLRTIRLASITPNAVCLRLQQLLSFDVVVCNAYLMRVVTLLLDIETLSAYGAQLKLELSFF